MEAPKIGRPPKYDWELWTDGQEHIILRDQDYDCRDESMIVYLRQKGRETNRKVAIELVENGLHFQFIDVE